MQVHRVLVPMPSEAVIQSTCAGLCWIEQISSKFVLPGQNRRQLEILQPTCSPLAPRSDCMVYAVVTIEDATAGISSTAIHAEDLSERWLVERRQYSALRRDSGSMAAGTCAENKACMKHEAHGQADMCERYCTDRSSSVRATYLYVW